MVFIKAGFDDDQSNLIKFGFTNPVKYKNMHGGVYMAEKKFKEIETNAVKKLSVEGDFIEGEYIGIEESKLYADSWALKFKDADTGKNTVSFINKIAYDLVVDNVAIGTTFRLKCLGEKKTEDGRNAYKTYKLWVESE